MRKMLSFFLCVLMLSNLSLFASAEDTFDGFKLESFQGVHYAIPDSWELKSENDEFCYYRANLGIASMSYIQISKVSYGLDTFTTTFRDHIIESFRRGIQSKYNAVSTEEIEFAGREGFVHVCTGIVSGYTLECQMYCVTGNDYLISFIFGIEGTASTDVKNLFNAQISKMIESVDVSDFMAATSKPEPTAAPTTGESNALRKAYQYLNVMAFSRSGLISQLEYDGFSTSEATYAVDNCNEDWNEQAVSKAAQYLSLMAFSRDRLIQQLEHDGFTHDQAVYGAQQNGY